MRIVLISDTHGLHRQLDVPAGDLLIHAGDFTLNSKPDWIYRTSISGSGNCLTATR